MTQLVFYTSILVCVALAVYFLQGFLSNRRLRASLWWATGFLSFAFGVLAMTVTSVYGFHRILLVLTFAFIAASVAFLYYAASTLFFYRRSFFREIFTAILFIVSFALFLIPKYLLQEGRMVEIIGSPTIVLFVVAFLVLAVVFNRVVKGMHKRYRCKRFVALQSLTLWIVGVWSLYIASFWGSIMVAGLVSALSLCGFVFIWYKCKGGVNMVVNRETYIQQINGVESMINLGADSARENLDTEAGEISNLSSTVTLSESYDTWGLMVNHTSEIRLKEKDLADDVVELAENVLELVRSALGDAASPIDGAQIMQIDKIPFGQMGGHSAILFNRISESATEIKTLAGLASPRISNDRALVRSCCNLVILVCDVENLAVTECKWHELSEFKHPGGMIGHTYNILLAYKEKTGKNYAEEFRNRFEQRADSLFGDAGQYRGDAQGLRDNLGDPNVSPTDKQAADAAAYLQDAVNLLNSASELISDASDFVSSPEEPGP